MRALCVIACLAAAALTPAAAAATSDEFTCSACERVAAALDRRLAAEGARNDVDLRGRLGPQPGQRTGKKVAWQESEQRLQELFDGLCERDLGAPVFVRAAAGDDDDDEDDDVVSASGGRWIAKGAPIPRGYSAVPADEAESRGKQLENYCANLLARIDEPLADILQKEEGGIKKAAPSTRALVCGKLTDHCRGAAAWREEL